MRSIIYTVEIDDRFGGGKVTSRIGLSSLARLYNPQTSLFSEISAENAREKIHGVLVYWLMKASFSLANRYMNYLRW